MHDIIPAVAVRRVAKYYAPYVRGSSNKVDMETLPFESDNTFRLWGSHRNRDLLDRSHPPTKDNTFIGPIETRTLLDAVLRARQSEALARLHQSTLRESYRANDLCLTRPWPDLYTAGYLGDFLRIRTLP